MSVLYAINEFDIRRQALQDAMAQQDFSRATVGDVADEILGRADKILAWYKRDADTQKIEPQ